MRGVRFLLILALLVLVVGAASGVAAAGPEAEGHVLVRSDDLVRFGNVYTIVAATLLDEGRWTGSGVPAGWDEARTTSLLVGWPEDRQLVAIVSSQSYRFTSPAAAEMAFSSVEDPGTAFSWQMRAVGISILDQDTAALLANRAMRWYSWYGADREGLPAYLLRVQVGSYIEELVVSVPHQQDAFGRAVFNHVTRTLLRWKTANEVLSITPTEQAGIGTASVSPQYYGTAYAYRVYQWMPNEFAAAWRYPYGSSPHYVGPGGDAWTCPDKCGSAEHGCISNWNWRTLSPESELMIPKTFILCAYPDSMAASHYTATVWIN